MFANTHSIISVTIVVCDGIGNNSIYQRNYLIALWGIDGIILNFIAGCKKKDRKTQKQECFFYE